MAELDASQTARLRRRWLPGASLPTKAAALGGTPAAIVLVWVLEHWVVHDSIPAVVAVAIGSLASSAAAFLTRAGRVALFALDHVDRDLAPLALERTDSSALVRDGSHLAGPEA